MLLLEFLDDLLYRVVSMGFLSSYGVTNQEYGPNSLIVSSQGLLVYDYGNWPRRFESFDVHGLAELQQSLVENQAIMVVARKRRIRDEAGEAYILCQSRWLNERMFRIHLLGVFYNGELREDIVSHSDRQRVTDFTTLAIARVSSRAGTQGLFSILIRVNLDTRIGFVQGLFPELLPGGEVRQQIEEEVRDCDFSMAASQLQ